MVEVAETRAQIRFGLDPSDEYVDIEEALERAGYYRCPECGEELIVRHGDVRIWHFAHSGFSGGVISECTLRTEQDVKKWEDEFRISPIEKDEKARRIRPIIMFDPWNEKFDLYGVIPTAKYDEFDVSQPIDQQLLKINIESLSGMKGILPKTVFNPNRVEVKVPLEVSSEKYEINIETELQSVKGIWSHDSILEKDVFVGNETRAELKKRDYRFRMGEIVYIVLDNEPEITENETIYRLGNRYLLSFDVLPKTFPRLKEILNLSRETLDQNIFHVDIILPPEIHPNPLEPIEGVPDSHTLISIVPPKHLDPTIEIVNIPFDERGMTTEKKGPGIPRYILEYFLQDQPKRISVYWGRRHKSLMLNPNSQYQRANYLASDNEMKAGINLEKNGRLSTIHPWSKSSLLYVDKETLLSGGSLSLFGPEEMTINLEGFGDNKIFRLTSIPLLDVLPIIEAWVEEDIQKIRFGFSTLGNINITIGEPEPEQDVQVIEESAPQKPGSQKIEVDYDSAVIKAKMREMKPLPNKLRWTHIKQLLELDEETPNFLIPGGTKKQFRKLHTEVKREEKSQ